MKEIKLSFGITEATVEQRIKLVSNAYTEEDIISGLRDMSILTTTWHNGVNGKQVNLETIGGELIGIIVSQEIDGNYADFQLI